MDNISKVILDDSQYTSRVEAIAQAWSDAADQEEKSATVSQTAMKKRLEDLDVLDKSMIDHMNVVKNTQATESALNKATALSAESNGKYSKTIKGVTDRMKSWVASMRKTKKAQKELTAEKRKQLRVFAESKQALKDEIAQTTILGTNLGQLGKTLKTLKVVSMAWVRTLGVMKVALISTGIGAIVVVLGSLVAWLTKTTEGSDFLNKKLAAVGAVVNSVMDVFMSFGKTVFEAITNPLAAIKSFGKGVTEFFQNPIKKATELWSNFRDTAKEIIEDVAEDAKRAESIAVQRQKLRDAERDLRVEFAQTRAEIEKRKKGSDDINNSIEKRQKLAQEAFAMENALLRKQTALAQKNVDLIEASNNLSTSSLEDLDNLADAQVALADIQQSSFTLQTELQNKINGLQKEQADKEAKRIEDEQKAREEAHKQRMADLAELKKEYQDLALTIMEAFNDIEYDNATPIEKLQIKEANALEKLAATREQFLVTSKRALSEGLITQEDINRGIEQLDIITDTTKRKFANAIGALLDPDVADVPTLEIKEFDVKVSDPKTITGPLKAAITEPIKKSFKEAFGEGLEAAADFFDDNKDQFDAFKGFFQDITDIFTSGIDAQIGKIDELIEAHDSQIEELEKQLETQASAKEKGLSNDLGILQKELDQEKAQREKAITERQELEKKAAKAKLINDVVQQSSSLITASAQIFQAMSSIPFVGVPLAIGFIATMFGAFAKAKIDAAKASKLSKGTGNLSKEFNGYVGPKSDLYGNGYAITDPDTGEDMGVRISGKEPLINEAVGQGVNRKLFEDMNRNPGKYQHFDIMKAMKLAQSATANIKNTVDHENKVFGASGGNVTVKTAAPASSAKNYEQYLVGKPTHKVVVKNGIKSVIEL